MSPDEEGRIQGVIDHIALRDLFLFESRFERGDCAWTELPESAVIEEMRAVEAGQIAATDGPSGQGMLQIKVTLGTRAALEPEQSADAGTVLFTIEASFIVEYLAEAELEHESIRLFANHNGVHNVWPFWRQHVADVIDRARLPRFVVPLFSGQS